MAKVAIDVDGVLADFTKAFIGAVNSIWPARLKPDFVPTDWDWTNSGLTHGEISKVWWKIKKTSNWWLGLDAYSDNVGALAMWMASRTDHDIWLCTSRAVVAGLTCAKQTDIWVQSCGLRPVNNFMGIITVTNGNKKSMVYEAAEIEWSIDDKWETVIDCGLIGSFEHKAYLLNQTWNKDASVYRRVNTLEDFLLKVDDGKANAGPVAVRHASGDRAAGVDQSARNLTAAHQGRVGETSERSRRP